MNNLKRIKQEHDRDYLIEARTWDAIMDWLTLAGIVVFCVLWMIF